MKDEDTMWIFLLLGIGVGIFLGLVVGSLGVWNGENELGQAICEQEYDMDFGRYEFGKLYCEPKETETEKYDGIIISLEKE